MIRARYESGLGVPLGLRVLSVLSGSRLVVRVGSCVFVLVVLLLLVVAGCAFGEPSGLSFEVVSGSFGLVPSSLQAGAHSDWTLAFDVAHEEDGKTHNDLRSTVVNFPAGFMGNSLAVPACKQSQLLAQGAPLGAGTLCQPASQVGVVSVEVTVKTKVVTYTFPLYNVETTSFGVTAELGFKEGSLLTQTLPVTVRPSDSGLTGTSPNILEIGEPHNVLLTLWGVPASHEHDAERGEVCEEFSSPNVVECLGGGVEAKYPEVPFVANPTNCSGSLEGSMKADSWEEPQPEDWFSTPVEVGPRGATTQVGPFVGCERVRFEPSLKTEPTSTHTESPSGLSVSLEVPQTWDDPYTIATSNVKDVTVTLPEGYTVNPSEGNGLEGCTPQQYAAESAFSLPGEGCPAQSKIGTVTIETPVLADKVEGSVYLAEPYDNPFSEPPEHPNGSLLALYVVAKLPERGIIVKSPGKVEPNLETGQLTSTFENLPQQPFSRVTFKLTQGTTSPLVSPQLCGTYTTQAELAPSSEPGNPRSANNTLEITSGIGGSPCPAGSLPPFKPVVLAGTTDNIAGGYSPFYLRISREDGEQELTRFSTVLPPGLTGNLTGIPFCSEAQIEAARHAASGLEELEDPSCPAASEIGRSLVGAGVGGVLAWTPGKVYLAGPYKGAPFSIVSVTSATVGPFDLGTVVIRFALQINPLTAQAEIEGTGSEAIPHIIDGIVVHVREIHVYMERHDFVLNPTSCAPMSISDTINGGGADPSNPADQDSVTVATPFQAADCQNLQFKPSLKASTTGKTSRKIGASLKVTLTYPNAPLGTQTNIRSVKVDLPEQLPSRLSTLQKACPIATFEANPAACQPDSRVGTAIATTPILPESLKGPAYFVSHAGLKFPELIIVLQGYEGVKLDLHGETFISKQGVTSSTFRAVPDAPVGKFEINLPQGTDSALAANTNLCKLTRTILKKKKTTIKINGHKKSVTRKIKEKVPGSLTIPTAFTAQNGTTIHTTTPITITNCPKATTKTKKKTNK